MYYSKMRTAYNIRFSKVLPVEKNEKKVTMHSHTLVIAMKMTALIAAVLLLHVIAFIIISHV